MPIHTSYYIIHWIINIYYITYANIYIILHNTLSNKYIYYITYANLYIILHNTYANKYILHNICKYIHHII